MTKLADQEFNLPVGKGEQSLAGDDLRAIHERLGNDWQVVDGHHLEKDFSFNNFQSALNFINKVGELAEQIDHHPELYLSWGRATVRIWTHSIGGLSEADFIFAARCDRYSI